MGKRVCAALLTLVLLGFGMVSAFAAEVTPVNASLSCYIHAMGGVEFGAPLLSGAQVEVEPDGSKTMTLFFTKSSVTIYGVTCDTFIDLSPSFVTDTNGVPSGTLGFYEADGTLNTADVTYTLSTDTAQNPQQEQVHYVTSLTFPIREEQETYQLSLFVNSNVMGCQLGDGSGSGSSNTPGVATKHTAKLTIDWESAEKIVEASESTNQSATVEYTVESGYEVEIPATITVDAATRKGSYSVTAQNFVIGEQAYVTVTASESGELTNGTDALAFTNTLAEGQLKETGDTLAGTVEVTDAPSNPGKYTGTIDFVINYYAGE